MADDAFETSTSRIYHRIREWIISGQLAPGTRLVRRTLSKQLGVSPIPVTEALLKLGEEGLVETAPMYGSRVALMSLDAVRNDQMLREALECQIARLCCQHPDAEGLGALTRLADALDLQMAQASGDSAVILRQALPMAPEDAARSLGDARRPGMQEHFEFHMALARLSGFLLLERELRKVWTRRLMCMNWLNATLFPVPAGWHRQLVDAIATGDPDHAEAAARVHVRHGQEHDLEILRRLQDKTVAGIENPPA